ncbi:hypothetical protein [Salinicoccus halodurans]|uniref:hypothetical protein n=1 Tax=Salinicoccus halodurans TaxID=407035 RepID=UPI000B1E720F|nr:hypothetical protein [Salinicoccus halodurans]
MSGENDKLAEMRFETGKSDADSAMMWHIITDKETGCSIYMPAQVLRAGRYFCWMKMYRCLSGSNRKSVGIRQRSFKFFITL